MGAVVVLGEPALVAGYALAGATVITAVDPAEARRAWANLPADTALVILTVAAAQALPDDAERAGPMTVVMSR